MTSLSRLTGCVPQPPDPVPLGLNNVSNMHQPWTWTLGILSPAAVVEQL